MLDIEMQKITVELPRHLLKEAQESTGKGISQTLRDLLQEHVDRKAQLNVLKLIGSYRPSITAEEMRSWEDD